MFEPIYILGLFVGIPGVTLTELVALKLSLSLGLLGISSVGPLNITRV